LLDGYAKQELPDWLDNLDDVMFAFVAEDIAAGIALQELNKFISEKYSVPVASLVVFRNVRYNIDGTSEFYGSKTISLKTTVGYIIESVNNIDAEQGSGDEDVEALILQVLKDNGLLNFK